MAGRGRFCKKYDKNARILYCAFYIINADIEAGNRPWAARTTAPQQPDAHAGIRVGGIAGTPKDGSGIWRKNGRKKANNGGKRAKIPEG